MAAALLPTTSLQGQTAFDLGCSTGVLGRGAALRGAQVHYADVDEESVRVSAENTVLNGVPALSCTVSDLLADVPLQAVDLLIANLYADLLVDVLADDRLQELL